MAFSITFHPPLLPHDYCTPTEAAKLANKRWHYALGGELKDQLCALGQLVYYRCISDDKTAANAAAGIFAGWRVESGLKYKYVLTPRSRTRSVNTGSHDQCLRQS